MDESILVPPGVAPLEAVGAPQIIPNRGAHEQIMVSAILARDMALLGLIQYDPEYGPGAHVYRPIGPADTEKVRSWIG